MLPEKQQQAYEAFSTAVRQNDILDPSTTRLIYLGAAMALGCYP
jgi:alkylhydroperoxidase/carboxymuconolactone decarboxylase family protein YurZ